MEQKAEPDRKVNRTHRYGLKGTFCAVCGVWWDTDKAEQDCPGRLGDKKRDSKTN